MSQTWNIDTIVPGTTSPSTDIQKIIDGLNALRSTFSGATEPLVENQTAFMLWADTANDQLKIRNASNTGWIVAGKLSAVNLGLLALAGGNLTGGINGAKTTVASALTPDIFATPVGNLIDYTGTITATGFVEAPQAGAQRTLLCASACSFMAGANMLIDGMLSGQIYTASAGERIEVHAVTPTQFRLYPNVSLYLSTPVATTSGTFVDFTGIPVWARQITVMFNGVSTNGGSYILVQIGDSGGIETTGYAGSAVHLTAVAAVTASFTSGFGVITNASSDLKHGAMVISLMDLSSRTWAASHSMGFGGGGRAGFGGGTKSLTGVLDRVRVTMGNGTDVFDAGSINILYAR